MLNLYLLFIKYSRSWTVMYSINWTKLVSCPTLKDKRFAYSFTLWSNVNNIRAVQGISKLNSHTLKLLPIKKQTNYQFHSLAIWWTQLTIPKSEYWYNNNAKFRVFFTTSNVILSDPVLVSVERHVWRIVESLTFCHNLFYIGARHWMFGNKLFMEEILIFNWESQLLAYKLFKFVHVFVYLKDLSHGSTAWSIFKLLHKLRLDFTFQVDINTHFKTQRYLQKYSIFTIGLIPTNYDPWSVSYPIPTYTNSPKIQLLFTHLLLHIRSLTS